MRQRKRRKTMRPDPSAKPSSSARNAPAAPAATPTLCTRGLCAALPPKHPAPSTLNDADCAEHLAFSSGNLVVEYSGPGREQKDAAAVRANCPVPPTGIALYYFEARVISVGATGRIGVGLCAKQVKLDKMPGWEQGSYGYHGDDGCAFKTTGHAGEKYGPKYGDGDVVGCCWDLVDNSVFFTRNGIMLGTAFRDLSGVLYPTIGMQTKGGRVSVNFGNDPFMFDIESFAREQRYRVLASALAVPLPADDDAVADAVLGYMVHSGYAKTAKAFAKNAGRKSALAAAIAAAHPDGTAAPVLNHNKQHDDSSVVNSSSLSMTSVEDRQQVIAKVMSGDIAGAQAFAREKFPGLKLEDPETNFLLKTQHFIELLAAGKVVLDHALQYGKNELLPLHELFPERLEEVYSLLAYKDPASSPVAHLVDVQRRELVADRLNMAILESQGRPVRSTLERLIAQSQTVLETHAEVANGPAALLRGVDDFR